MRLNIKPPYQAQPYIGDYGRLTNTQKAFESIGSLPVEALQNPKTIRIILNKIGIAPLMEDYSTFIRKIVR